MQRAERKEPGTLPPKANLRPAEVAAFLDVSLTTIYEMLDEAAPILPWIRVRGQKRIPREAFLKWYDSQLRSGS